MEVVDEAFAAGEQYVIVLKLAVHSPTRNDLTVLMQSSFHPFQLLFLQQLEDVEAQEIQGPPRATFYTCR